MRLLFVLLLATFAAAAHAQLSSPLPPGSGPGIHSPLSPIAPLVDRVDVVSWSMLTDVGTKMQNKRFLPVFSAAQKAMHMKMQRVQGFMLPLDAGEKQTRFLLSSVPLTCSFCMPGGPESMIEVRTKTPIRYTQDVVVVQGRFNVLEDDPHGLYYRLTEAVSVLR